MLENDIDNEVGMPSQNYYYQNQSNNGDEQLEYPEFFLKARDLYEIDEEKLEVLCPENPPQEPKRNLLMILTPVFLMLMLMIFVRSRMTSGGMMYILYFAASMVISGAMSVWAYFYPQGAIFRTDDMIIVYVGEDAVQLHEKKKMKIIGYDDVNMWIIAQ